MKKKLTALLLVLCLALSLVLPVAAAEAEEGIVILYTNDAHCAVDEGVGYAGLAAYEKEMAAAYGAENVTLVDAGDAVQGGPVGTLSQGQLIVDIMNQVGYDVVTPGNHEFDYGMARMQELMGMHKAAVVSCNFIDLKTNKPVFKPYTVIDYGDMQVAFVGITTPKTYTSSTPKYFQDAAGNYIFGLCEDASGKKLYDTVQASVNAAKAEGADVIVAVGHCGVGEDLVPWESTEIIKNTTGIDAFIDGHSHSTIKGETYKNASGEEVLLTSSGTKLSNIGKLVVAPDGAVTSELIAGPTKENPDAGYTKKDADTDAFIKTIQTKQEALLGKVVAKTSVPLIVKDPATGTRLIRNTETNLGDLCADAYRSVLGADVAVVNGGGIRADIPAGDITYNQIINVHPFGNMACVIEATGQEILDLLEMMARSTPAENGGFMQVSGMTYEIHTYIKSAVVLDDKGSFVSVDGEYRVKNVLIGGVPLQPDKTYTLASHNYLIKNGGDGYAKFADNKLLLDETMIDNQVLITYIVDKLGGVVGSEYENLNGQGRIAVKLNPFTDLLPGAWYEKPVGYVYGRGIMNGTSATAFSPDTMISRASFITMLYRAEGSPAITGKASALYSDCLDGTWYSDALVWAADQKIVTGGGAFSPEAELTRSDMALFLYRYIQSEGGGFTGAWSFLLDYADRAEIPADAVEAVSYCSMNGIINGMDGKFVPGGTSTRAMAAAVIQRYEDFISAQKPAA
jgi:2',3'-cyclic-nucleotide 2'-phosphodiesterase (5'-nucleotidase family)